MEEKMTKFTTIIERDGERLELVLEEPMSQDDFETIKIEMKRVQIESELAKELAEQAAKVAKEDVN